MFDGYAVIQYIISAVRRIIKRYKMGNCAIILAGGEGKRMKSDKPKTLSEVLGKPMLMWVISALKNAGINDICVVKGFYRNGVYHSCKELPYRMYSFFWTLALPLRKFAFGLHRKLKRKN